MPYREPTIIEQAFTEVSIVAYPDSTLTPRECQSIIKGISDKLCGMKTDKEGGK